MPFRHPFLNGLLEGLGRMTVGKKEFMVEGETLVVHPYTAHKLLNTGLVPLRHLVIANPPFNPKDVILLEGRWEIV